MADGIIPEDRLQDPARFRFRGRDPERTPMQWDGTTGRGFTTGEPWLPFSDPGVSVALQDADPDSILNLYRRAIAVRRTEPALHSGVQDGYIVEGGCVSFVRRTEGASAVMIAANTATSDAPITLPGPGTVLVATHRGLEGGDVTGTLTLPPLGAAWIRLQ
jgi:alpha-glucosidase